MILSVFQKNNLMSGSKYVITAPNGTRRHSTPRDVAASAGAALGQN